VSVDFVLVGKQGVVAVSVSVNIGVNHGLASHFVSARLVRAW
jgi:hypothetical protein